MLCRVTYGILCNLSGLGWGCSMYQGAQGPGRSTIVPAHPPHAARRTVHTIHIRTAMLCYIMSMIQINTRPTCGQLGPAAERVSEGIRWERMLLIYVSGEHRWTSDNWRSLGHRSGEALGHRLVESPVCVATCKRLERRGWPDRTRAHGCEWTGHRTQDAERDSTSAALPLGTYR